MRCTRRALVGAVGLLLLVAAVGVAVADRTSVRQHRCDGLPEPDRSACHARVACRADPDSVRCERLKAEAQRAQRVAASCAEHPDEERCRRAGQRTAHP